MTIYCLRFRECPNLEGQVPVFISPRKMVTQLYPQALGSLFVAFYDSQGYGGDIRLAFTWSKLQQKTPFPNNLSVVIEVCLTHRCIQTAVL
jgi:hypothetical protein